jgi:hypothetical protein
VENSREEATDTNEDDVLGRTKRICNELLVRAQLSDAPIAHNRDRICTLHKEATRGMARWRQAKTQHPAPACLDRGQTCTCKQLQSQPCLVALNASGHQEAALHSRWATTTVVRPTTMRSSAACTSRSLCVSSALVASSSNRILLFLRMARAMAIRCFWPPAVQAVQAVIKDPGWCNRKGQR